VNHANPGDTVRVAPGVYTEQVTIGAGKNDLTLRSARQLQATIKAPPAIPALDPKAIVRVNAAQGVTVRDFIITGPGDGGCDSLRFGVRVDGGGSATIRDNHITHIRDILPPPALSGCQNGVGILVGRQFEGQIGTAKILDNTIDNYQKGGIVVDNTGSSAEVAHNVTFGVGPSGTIAQNGIQISRGATAAVHHNEVSGHAYLGPDEATGILLFLGGGGVLVEHNRVTDNQTGIRAISATGPVIQHNKVFGSSCGTTPCLSPAHGIQLCGTTDCFTGFGPTTGATVSHNRSNNNEGDGIRVSGTSSGNTIEYNHMKGNGDGVLFFDAHDTTTGSGTAGTGNTWDHNKCNTSSPQGLCED
jgi:nitrous oxidase accessory protein NosD